MRNHTQRRPEQRIADDLGLTTADLERIVRAERARDRAEHLVTAVRELELRTRQYLAGDLVTYPAALLPQARALLAVIDAPIGGAL